MNCEQIPCEIMDLVTIILNLLRIGVPIILVVMGMLDLGKAVIASNPDEIKKNQKMFLKRLINVVLMFLVIYAVEMLINIIEIDNNVATCISTIISNNHNNMCTY